MSRVGYPDPDSQFTYIQQTKRRFRWLVWSVTLALLWLINKVDISLRFHALLFAAASMAYCHIGTLPFPVDHFILGHLFASLHVRLFIIDH